MTAPPCADQPWLFDSTDPADHHLARRYCLGEPGYPACHMLAACADQRGQAVAATKAGELPAGTWAGVLYPHAKVQRRRAS